MKRLLYMVLVCLLTQSANAYILNIVEDTVIEGGWNIGGSQYLYNDSGILDWNSSAFDYIDNWWNITDNWWNITDSRYIINISDVLDVNESALNETTARFLLNINDTIDARLSTTFYNANTSNATYGTIEGILSDTYHLDGNYDGITYNFTEVSGSPGLDVRFNFTNITDLSTILIRYKTSDLSGDFPNIQLYEYIEDEWEDYELMAESLTFVILDLGVYDSSSHIENGLVQMRIYEENNGNINDLYMCDWIVASLGYGTPSGTEVDPFWEEQKVIVFNNFTESRNNATAQDARFNDYLSLVGGTLTGDLVGTNVNATLGISITAENKTLCWGTACEVCEYYNGTHQVKESPCSI